MIYLRSIDIKNKRDLPEGFPFNLSFIKKFEKLEFKSSVTFFAGENGSGKSTLLEAIAAGVKSIIIGGETFEKDITLSHAIKLSKHMKFVWTRKTGKGFFLRAEDFFRFARKMHEMAGELEDEAKELEGKLEGYGLKLARSSLLGQKASLTSRYGEDLHANSHGESFLKIFQERFVPGGLYLLDEPESPLSPQRQLSLLSLIKNMVSEGQAQFIISTHSPILMAFPDAIIHTFDTCPIKEINYEDLSHVNLTRDFLNDPELYLRHL